MGANGAVESFIFDENNAYINAYLVTFISNDFVLAYSDIIVGHPAISEVFTITKSNAEYIEEIDNVPALQWFCEKLGMEEFSPNDDWKNTVATDMLLRFPLVFEGYSNSTCFLQYEQATNKIRTFYTEIKPEQKFRLGYVSPIKSAEEFQETCQQLQMTSAEMIFCYSCLFRKLFANSIAKWELGAFKKSAICGAFMHGEIGTKNNQVQLLNGSACFFTLAEKEVYIEPDLSVFDSVSTLLEANDDFINIINNLGNSLKSDIFASFIDTEEQVKERFSYGTSKFYSSIPQFLKSQAEKKSLQICLISIEDSQNLLKQLGDEDFTKLADENIKQCIDFANKHYPQHKINFYRYDAANFFFTVEQKVSDHFFAEIVHSYSQDLGSENFVSLKDDAQSSTRYYNNFTYTLQGLAIQQLLNYSKDTSLSIGLRRLNHCDLLQEDITNLHEEFQMVAALKSIIKDKAIIPYFQGIYDNKKNCFRMYEALMRLQHPDGRMLFPNDFMDIAKKYNLYLPLSLCMVVKVFELFRDRHETITLNISAYDILSEEFRNTLFEYLETLPNPQNFVFELLETEAFTDLQALRIFIHRVKQCGCKFAVDDFGSGYSNFIEFGNIEVDFLKINGSLTKLLGTDFNYNHILSSIAFMSEKMHVELIAEFVETATTQKLLVENNVHYSQGYLFSKPMPFAELVVVSKENLMQCEMNTEEREDANDALFKQQQVIKENILLYTGGFFVALFTILSLIFFVDYNHREFKKINDRFLVELATSLSDKIALFVEESMISLEVLSVALSDTKNFEDQASHNKEMLFLLDKTKFSNLYISYLGMSALDAYGKKLDIPIESIYNKTMHNNAYMHPIYTDRQGNKVLIFSTNIIFEGEKIGELYGVYKLDEISKLLSLKSFGGEAFYHISQVDGTPVYLSGRQENAFKSGDMYSFIGSLDIINGHTAISIKQDMYNSETVLLNYKFKEEERSAVMVRIPQTDWCVVSIVLDEINMEMLKNSNKSTLIFISFLVLLYGIYFSLMTLVFKRHKAILVNTLDSARALSSSLQLSIEKDSLTGTYSRATAIEKISTIIATQNQKGTLHALAILDIDNFKSINDTYGHHTGDIYLQSFISAVKHAIKPGNILGRLGGDEFLLLLNDTKDEATIRDSFDKIFDNIHKISLGASVDLSKVSVSAGIVLISENEKSYEELMIEADNTLYAAKREGKNKYIFTHER